MIIAASTVSVLIMLAVPIVLVIYLTHKFSLSWKLALAGALTFIASQVLHIPVVYGASTLFNNNAFSIPDAWAMLFNSIILDLLAGVFEETRAGFYSNSFSRMSKLGVKACLSAQGMVEWNPSYWVYSRS